MSWEIFGYIGTILVLGSFLIEDMFRLRIVNLIGAVFWVMYGIGLDAKPTIIVNVCVIIIHIFWLIRNKINKNG
jgi:hypothetical protein